jgi:RNA-directed DNA polymerase
MSVYEWKAIPWREIDKDVFKLQKRIYQAAKRGDRVVVHRLQRLLIKSWSTRCLAVRRVTQDNHGKKTAGIDGIAKLSQRDRLKLVAEIKEPPKPMPVRRVWIPKPGKDELRPLGIPVMRDRAYQALVKLALEPEWEGKFEPNSYGFRPGRSCHDAIEAIFASLKYVPRYVLDADIKGCFDNIDHTALLAKLQTYPALRRIIRGWLQAGIMDGLELTAPKRGTPQGGVISPLLANIALHGLEEVIATSFPIQKKVDGVWEWKYRPKVIRYADDFVILHKELAVIERCKEIAGEWLSRMGLELKDSKTRISHTLSSHEGNVGFDFLGFNVRQFPVGKTHHGKCGGAAKRGTDGRIPFKTIVKPSKDAVKRHYRGSADIINRHSQSKQEDLIRSLNPRIRGWCNYFTTSVATDTFNKLDHLVVRKLLRWGKRRHPNKSRRRMAAKYFNVLRNKGSLRPWDFIASNGARLIRYADTGIKRHVLVGGDRSPYDGDFVYWTLRLGKHPTLPTRVSRLLQRQKDTCWECGLRFRYGDAMEVDHLIPRERGGKDVYGNLQLLHAHCHKAKTARDLAFARADVNSQDAEEPYEVESLTYGSEDQSVW